MKLHSFRVRKFRNILDSGEVQVQGDVTCLVGMNEAGKTAVLTALNRLNPTDGSKFSVQDDYPRQLLIPDRRTGTIDETEPVVAEFALESADIALVDAHLGSGVLVVGDQITIKVSYDTTSGSYWLLPVRDKVAVANVLSAAGAGAAVTQALESAPDWAALRVRIDELIAAEDTEAPESDQLAQLRLVSAALDRATSDGTRPKPANAAAAILRPRTPKFFYFSNYSMLQGRIDLDNLDMEANDRAGSTPTQTARSLLRLAQTTPEGLTGGDYEYQVAELEAVSNDLTEQVFTYWKQNPNLRVSFKVDTQAQDNPSHGSPPIIAHHLDVRVEDQRHHYTNNFDRRSSGFRWFFSFLAAFTEFEMRDRDADFVVLLDEPGLTLHGRAQADFLHFINERLASSAQVVYTTHSPFMVETDKIERVRIVEDGGPKVGAVVSKEVLRVGADSLFPLQAALGYDVAQHLFIGEANLLVEGPSDFIYLDTLSRFLESKKMPHLDSDWRVMPAGGANNIPSFVALLGNKMEVSVLVDAGTEGGQRLQRAIDAGRLSQKRLIEVGAITKSKNSDIEDVFEVDDYLRIYNAAFKRKTTEKTLGAGDRIVKRIGAKLPTGTFDHYRPAETLLRDQATILPTLSQATLDRFALLFEAINESRV